MVNWQQIGSLVIVGVAFVLLLKKYVAGRKKGALERDGHCDACEVSHAVKEKGREIRYTTAKEQPK